MNIGELKKLLDEIPPELDHLQVWIDSDESEGGRPVNDVQLKYAEDCDLDGDEIGDEITYLDDNDDMLEKIGLSSFPEDESSIEFTQMIMKMADLGYRWEGCDIFSKQILAIKF